MDGLLLLLLTHPSYYITHFLGLQEIIDKDPPIHPSTYYLFFLPQTSDITALLSVSSPRPPPLFNQTHHHCSFYRTHQMEMDWAMRGQMQIPSFGNWDYYDELPVTQYFDSTRHGGLLRHHFLMEDAELDLFKIPPSPLPYQYHLTQTRRVNKEKKHHHLRDGDLKEMKKQRRVCDENQQKLHQGEMELKMEQGGRQRTPKAVDEDLYKIPPELLLHQRPKKKIVVCDFWKRCLGLNCVP